MCSWSLDVECLRQVFVSISVPRLALRRVLHIVVEPRQLKCADFRSRDFLLLIFCFADSHTRTRTFSHNYNTALSYTFLLSGCAADRSTAKAWTEMQNSVRLSRSPAQSFGYPDSYSDGTRFLMASKAPSCFTCTCALLATSSYCQDCPERDVLRIPLFIWLVSIVSYSLTTILSVL